jgi:hypothetical protein
MESSFGGGARATVLPSVPSGGSVRIGIKPSGEIGMYKLTVIAANLDDMGSAETLMDLGVQIGSSLLSQSLTFRSKRSDLFVYP